MRNNILRLWGLMGLSLFYFMQTVAQPSSPFMIRPSANVQNISVDSTFLSNSTLDLFANITQIYGLSMNMSINTLDSDFLVRVILMDDVGRQYLVAETYPELTENDTLVFTGYCEETSVLSGIRPSQLLLYIHHAELHIESIGIITTPSPIHHAPASLQTLIDSVKIQQIQNKVDRINQYNINHNKLWLAGVTEVSLQPYQTKMSILGCVDSTSTGCLEYYYGGIIDIGTTQSAPTQSNSQFIEEFDWRNRHGKNWMTSIKNQSSTPYCVAFATIGCLEAMTNLYFNRKINFDLSEQELASCCVYNPVPDTPISIPPMKALYYIKSRGAIMEEDDSFKYNKPQVCTREQITPNNVISITNYHSEFTSNEDLIKKNLIRKGPLIACISAGIIDNDHDRWGHSMILTGFGKIYEGMRLVDINPEEYPDNFGNTVESGDPRIGMTYWKFKNSWGLYNTDGYMYVIFNDLSALIFLLSIETPIRTLNYTDDDIICEDLDGDGYYNWGIGTPPSSLPSWAPYFPDGDDTNPDVGSINMYGRLEDIVPDHYPVIVIPSNNNSTNAYHAQYVHFHTEILSGVRFEVDNRLNFYNGAKLILRNGCTLIVKEGGWLNNVILEMEEGCKIILEDGGKIKMAQGHDFSPPLGAEVEIRYGCIE